MATATMPNAKPAKPKPASTAKTAMNRQPAKRTISVLEFFAEKQGIDKEKGIVYGAKLLGRISKNGHQYSDQALRDAAATYDGATVNRNHPPDRNATAERMVQDPFGVIRNPQVRITGNPATDGVYGDHHYPKADDWTPAYEERVERFPTTLGFSHNAVVTESVHDGQVTFTSVERVRSVDLVANPATTRGIFESEDYMGDDPNAPVADLNAAPEEAAEPTTEEQMCAALKMAVNAILDDDDMSIEEKKKKIATLMDAHDDAANGDGEGEGEGEGSGSGPGEGEGSGKPADDTASLRDRLTKLENEIKAKNALESARAALEKNDRLKEIGYRPSGVEVKAFSVLESDAERGEFVEMLLKANKPASGANGNGNPPPAKPRSTSANALESQRQAAEAAAKANGSGKGLPKTQDDLKAATGRLLAI